MGRPAVTVLRLIKHSLPPLSPVDDEDIKRMLLRIDELRAAVATGKVLCFVAATVDTEDEIRGYRGQVAAQSDCMKLGLATQIAHSITAGEF